MLAVLGLLVTEEPIEYHPLFEAYNKDIGPSIRHLDEVRAVSPFFFEVLAVIIGSLELNRALQGWENPGDVFSSGRTFKPDYYPGDVGFGKSPTAHPFSHTHRTTVLLVLTECFSLSSFRPPWPQAQGSRSLLGDEHQGAPERPPCHAWRCWYHCPGAPERQGDLCRVGTCPGPLRPFDASYSVLNHLSISD